jgi:uncharacterized protein YggE
LILPFVLFASTSLAAERFVSVSGQCELRVIPDRGSVELSMEKTLPSVAAAVAEVTKRIDAARAEVQKMSLAHLELQTSQFQVSERRDWEKDKHVFKGYSAVMGLTVSTSQVTRLGDVLGMSARLSLTGSGNLRTYLSHEKQQAEYLRCLDLATVDARVKGERLAAKFGAKLGAVLSVVEGPNQDAAPPPFENKRMSLAEASNSGAPSIDVGQHTLSSSIRVSFGLK